MKRQRIRRMPAHGLFSFEESSKKEKPEKGKITRKRETDSFIERQTGANPLDVLEEFLIDRKSYIEKSYSEQNKIVLFEWELYYSVLQRVKKGVKQNKLKFE